MKGIYRSITKVTLAFVLIFLLTGCETKTNPVETLPVIGPSIEETIPIIGPSVNETESIVEPEPIETTYTETEIDNTEIESTKETFDEETTSSESEQSSEVVSSESEETTSVQETTEVEETTEAFRFTFVNMEVHMYAQASVNVRSLPSTDGDIIFVLHVNDIVYVTGKCNETGWYRIDVEGQTLYVTHKYIGENKVVQKSSSAATTVKQPATTSAGFVYYKVAGQSPNREYEKYLYDQLNSLGIAWWYPYAVAQIWQESCWNPNSTNGRDHGICQFKGIYFQSRAEHFAGMKNADIWNPYDSLKVYAYYIRALLAACNNKVDVTLSYYICGDPYNWDQTYINHVMGWYNRLQKS